MDQEPKLESTERSARAPSDDLYACILDHLTIPVMIVERAGTLVYANKAAEIVISNRVLMTTNEDALSFTRKDDDSRVRSAIADVCANRSGHALELAQDQTHPTLAIVLPFDGASLDGMSSVLVLLSNPNEASATFYDVLRQQFRLSQTEAKIAAALGTGADLKEVARERGVSLNTLRTQLASIMEKTGLHRQAALVALVARIKTFL